jgi:hypothetical protein
MLTTLIACGILGQGGYKLPGTFTYTRGISRISDNINLDDKSVRSDNDQNNNGDSNESVEDLVSELFNDVINDNARKGNGNIDKGREQVTTTRFKIGPSASKV